MLEYPLTECRLIVDPPGGGAWNMAVDEHLLGWTAENGCCCWRFYRWEEPTLSLGYFQQCAEREGHDASRECPVVRRASGGGAIVHDRELTYSLTVPAEHPLARRRQWTYEAIHQTLIAVLSPWGIQARLYGIPEGGEKKSREFLCFNRRSSGDVVVGGVKVAGSAQRRAAEAVLQHGSVLLHRSLAAPELAGVDETSGAIIEPDVLMLAWQQRLAEVLRFQWYQDCLSMEEKDNVARIVAEKFGNASWTEKRRR
jgi:lipoate-protein ligase A